MKKTIVLLAIAASMPTFAQNNVYELAKVKAEDSVVTKSSQGIQVLSQKSHDKYIISIAGDGGFTEQFESSYPSFQITDLNLPYNGSYSYEIKSVKYVEEVFDTMNNGRSEDAVGKISIIDVKSGQFENSYGEILTTSDIKEPIKGSFPIKSKNK